MNKTVHSKPLRINPTTQAVDMPSKKHGTTFCPNCSGSGRYFYVDLGASPCISCNGSGLVRIKEKDWSDEDERFQLLS